MTQIVVDPELRKKLLNLTEFLEITDEQGKVLATVMPATDPSYYKDLQSPHDEAELRRRETSNEPRYNLQQVLDHLRKL